MLFKKRSLLITVAMLTVFGTPNLIGSESKSVGAVYEFDEITITANLTETERRNAGTALTIITAAEIEKRNVRDVSDLLRTVPGIQVTANGGRGQTSNVSIRGGNTSHTLVLIDGVRANSNTVGSYDFSGIQVDNIERIEILRGPQSSLYGSEAIGGVISIFTSKGAEGFKVRGVVEAGTDQSAHVSVSTAGGGEIGDFSISLGHDEADQIFAARETDNHETDPFRNSSVSGRFGLNLPHELRLDVTGRYLNGESEFDGFMFGVGAVDGENTRNIEEYQLTAKAEMPLTDRIKQTAGIGYHDNSVDGVDTGFKFEFLVDTLEFWSQSDIVITDSALLSLGYKRRDENGENKNTFSDGTNTDAFYGQLQIQAYDSVSVAVGIRNDNHSEFGGETTYRASGAWQIEDTGLRLHGSWGTGFRAPSFNELFFPGFGNPNLDAEESTGYDIGIEWTSSIPGVSIDITYFNNKFDDLISFDSSISLANNISEASAEGVEARIEAQITKSMLLGASYTFTDSENKDTGKMLPRRAQHRVTGFLDLSITDRLSAYISVEASDNTIDTDRTQIDDFINVNASAEYVVNESIKTYVKIQNIFDEDYEEVNLFEIPGFTAFIGVKIGL